MSQPKNTQQSSTNPLNGENPGTGVVPQIFASSTEKFMFDSIDAALSDLKAGRAIVVVDDENRENEGDLICAAQFATPDMINFMAVEARGLICLAMTGDRLDELDLPLMVTNITDPNQTAFTVSIDASPHLGVSTGISAEDRARTIQITLNPATKPSDLRRPGHIFPLRAKAGGVLKRAGHTEAAVDLSRLAGLYPAGVICEIQNPDGSMARLQQLIEYAKHHNLKIISIADLISYRLQHDRLVYREVVTKLPSQFGQFDIYAYRHTLDNTEHVAIVKGNPENFRDEPVMVRMHSECLTGDALGSLRCDCRMQLQAALKMIETAGQGVVVYLRQEGRGIGLINKLKAYSLQDMGLDTVEANERLGFPADLRDYGMGAQMLMDLGVKKIRLITNNPRKIAGVKGYGLEVVDRLPLLIEANDYNSYYLATKAKKLGHMLLQTYLVTVAIHWQDDPQLVTKRYERLEKLRHLVRGYDLLLQEEARPLAIALFDKPSLTVHLGFDQEKVASCDWYSQSGHPYVQAILPILDNLATLPYVQKLEFLISPGSDPLSNLQVQLDRQTISPDKLPSSVSNELETQKIYSLSKELED
ncbi:bifunctional 3,4-dihydroxy-2-butanone-4-phosphate synthase RibB/GTP cyclohydrolase II RibA [Nostoc sp. PCC 7120 = FACHB-418]|uniref:Riboflavin biosynthesis protein RibBA n=2 Tax=Nostocaceae TaxID=1162 RepID=A0A1Z4KJT4_ANAVA|nr:bifunctional 3,4-dihydroxy-2-butanone-4-phosphate synthase RibB/GTP cyclohydrolase II RibA [Anabaena cylindrica FACHB-318]MBD2267000.1 bifunctional 3,4-dihydroxy-2-butanone-4-phosphate synthase RibB/GTP cyclohydrolase II RibA [Anabaena sp. FACHB-709]MBD2275983.1 bifunctional 3,4-dihydroxy-2-butanone-4-phosphate synthase RibB/GTP cyclohydrolase II RibA [Nostoc sp. PCC 7120 = FACHB-418]MBD2285960.1 bifunctional 3,4-dihydroxy-2-butanone-4-phosphate synthase RibB/GTP cyclohydrolase II RibA [Anaba